MIHQDMTIMDILTRYPQHQHRLTQLLKETGLHCVGCCASAWETLGEGMRGHGKSEEEILELVALLNQTIQDEQLTITLTERAAEYFRTHVANPNMGLRFDGKRNGSSIEYALDLQHEAEEGDRVFVSEGISIFVPVSSVELLLGSIIDYNSQETGFMILAAPTQSCCGCHH